MDLLLGFEGRFAFGEISKILKFRVDSAASFEVWGRMLAKRRRQSSAGLESFRINGSLILPLEVGKCGIKSSCGRGSTPRSFSLLWNYSCRGEGEENPRLDVDQGQKLDFPSVLSRIWGVQPHPSALAHTGSSEPTLLGFICAKFSWLWVLCAQMGWLRDISGLFWCPQPSSSSALPHMKSSALLLYFSCDQKPRANGFCNSLRKAWSFILKLIFFLISILATGREQNVRHEEIVKKKKKASAVDGNIFFSFKAAPGTCWCF